MPARPPITDRLVRTVEAILRTQRAVRQTEAIVAEYRRQRYGAPPPIVIADQEDSDARDQ